MKLSLICVYIVFFVVYMATIWSMKRTTNEIFIYFALSSYVEVKYYWLLSTGPQIGSLIPFRSSPLILHAAMQWPSLFLHNCRSTNKNSRSRQVMWSGPLELTSLLFNMCMHKKQLYSCIMQNTVLSSIGCFTQILENLQVLNLL